MDTKASVAISIIIPCYNVPEEYIKRMLESIKMQTFSDYEIIVIDDGSKAEYHTVLEKLTNIYERAVLITTSNNGVSQARNIGVKYACGDYIAFVDADDLTSKYFLEEAHDALINTGADFVIGGTRYVKTLDVTLVNEPHKEIEYDIYRAEEVRNLYCYLGSIRQTYRFDKSYIGRGPHSRVVKREIAELTPFHKDLVVGEDHIWNLEVLSHCDCVCIVKSQWYWYWKNPNSALNRYNPHMYMEIKKALLMIEPLMDKESDSEYLTFQYLIIDSIHTVRRSIIAYANSDNRQLIEKTKKSIYSEYPFTKLKEWRFFRLAPFKYKVIALFYRFRILLFYWDSRSK